MCSICGGYYPLQDILRANETMKHRGKNASGYFEHHNFAMAHNRLSIIDLSEEANQPFHSPFCPHLSLVFNGEIYNYIEIKQQLIQQNVPFYTTSDTEVLLHAYAFWNEKCVSKFNGDFAFAIYNKHNGEVFLARDRLGNKPLFYSLINQQLLFASEIKAILEILPQPFCLEEVASWLLFGAGSIQQSIYQNIYSFPAAHYGIFKNQELKCTKYWDFTPSRKYTRLEEAIEKLDELLQDAVRIRLRSDVPVALSVSGGIDSSILAHYIQRLGGQCHFFGVSFTDFQESDESIHIQELGRNLEIPIQIISPHLSDFKQHFHQLVYIQDEIFRSFSVYAQFLLFQSIAPYCKVTLGGQGADELFGGYYHHAGRFIFQNRQEFEFRIQLYGKEALTEYMLGLKCSLNRELKLQLFQEDNARNVQKMQQYGMPIPSFQFLLERFLPDFNQSLWLDTTLFNLPHLLRYEDRNAMAVGVENRTPFTDYRIVEFAFEITEGLKFAKGYSKYLLRILLERLGSKKLAYRRDKIGFSSPEVALMKELGMEYESLFDVRWAIFQALKEIRK
ncbi:asparagine synthase (glutamine-hydrolyzing) [Helicobacter monodelphidis]|uniref:asparagine synthase (glutamine-hydrolyzing) n=1 Tax=Helicobacter sp. 15-1451 TaxID=2004995 RepID=UPI000DCDE02C|nr:asparagine synthase (glutamine-hydrolyzing) [Helicobacter sp. 15-1451]RAX58359.1 asparagine synthase (glutamine-hydrolyzing) [Helicobacter sp. 15-1451]